ncbi:NAD(P)/FAD-dependent oxidoreductase [Thermoproteus tenax]|uniref:Sulfide dehydrogenase, flavoprotein subunit n=1 Tax=Thermoproteus tenax (strain ATCC 35583 / DSM 2078 / JCM 9277 / NBRC 100435 / Kra 1) TaxID=768679 RepID=G4RLK9_THETK|nr:FAD/NAD(P)-binding oxidoreductase [Thermoproteus tenax]CCC82454.1 sulfide dehydrogenase, flavoprotein subunit [Thermoproteus tenax Kra 1]
MKKVVIIGGGIAGMTVAKTLIEGKANVEITVLNSSPHYFSGPSRPLLLTGEQSLDRIVRGYEEAMVRGVRVITGTVFSIDPDNRKVKYVGGYASSGGTGELAYDYLVVAPGVVLDGSNIVGYDKYRHKVANVYDPGRVHVLKNRVWSAERGRIVVYAPKAPYRCAPAPTETALLIDAVLRNRGVRNRFEIIHIDANDKTQPPVIADVVSQIYQNQGIQLVTNQEIVEITDTEVVTKSGERYKYDILALLEPNRAPKFIEEAGLGKAFVDVRGPQDLRHPKYDDILAAGDAAALPFPKNQEIAFESALFAANKILEMEGSAYRASVQYAFVGWAYVGNPEGRLETLSVRFGLDFTSQPPKPTKDPQPKREYTAAKDSWEQSYLANLFGYK